MSALPWAAPPTPGVTAIPSLRPAETAPPRSWLSPFHERFGALDRYGLNRLPEPQALIENVLDRRTLGLLAAPFGRCKTFVALDWALCAHTGKPWQGRLVRTGNDEPVLPPDRLVKDVHYGEDSNGRDVWDTTPDGSRFHTWEPNGRGCYMHDVLYVAAEGAHGLAQRVRAWEQAWRAPVSSGFVVVPRPIQLLDSAEVERFAEFVREERFDLVVFDTLSRCMVGGDENGAQDMGLAVAALDRIRAATNAGTVLAVHHTGKDGKTVRGSSVLEGASDTVYQIEGDPQYLRLHRTKRKDGPQQDEHQLRLKQVHGTSSCVLEVSNQASGRQDEISPSTSAAYRACLAVAAGGPLTKAQLREVIEEQANLSRAGAYNAISALVKADLLVEVGTSKRPQFIAKPDPGQVGNV